MASGGDRAALEEEIGRSLETGDVRGAVARIVRGYGPEILNALAKVDGLRVIARTSSFSFKGRSEDLRKVGKELGAATLLEGSVRKEGNRFRITAQLVSAADGVHLWSQTFDRDLTSLLAVQEEIAQTVAGKLERKLVAARPRAGPGAKVPDQVMLARHFFRQGWPDGYGRAVATYENAVALDPAYASSWSWLARLLASAGQPMRRARRPPAGSRLRPGWWAPGSGSASSSSSRRSPPRPFGVRESRGEGRLRAGRRRDGSARPRAAAGSGGGPLPRGAHPGARRQLLLAWVQAWWGDKDAAFASLERSRADGDNGLYLLKTDPLLRSLHGDPRYATLLEKLNLPPD